MNKAIIMAVSAAAGVAGIVVLHPAGGGIPGAAPAPTAGSSSGGTASTSGSSTGATSPVTTTPVTTTPATTVPAGPSPASTPTTIAAPPASPVGAVGKNENYGYGALAVKVTVKGARILDVAVSKLQTAESYSQQLAQQVIPMLRSEVLSAQSARIQAVSGATYTSEAYAYSLQSALDRLHFK